jgi:hypothetical protein
MSRLYYNSGSSYSTSAVVMKYTFGWSLFAVCFLPLWPPLCLIVTANAVCWWTAGVSPCRCTCRLSVILLNSDILVVNKFLYCNLQTFVGTCVRKRTVWWWKDSFETCRELDNKVITYEMLLFDGLQLAIMISIWTVWNAVWMLVISQ